MTIFDSHCHPQFPQYDADREETIKRTLAAGCGMICVGTDLEMSKKAIELAEKYDGVWATVGLHPNDASNLSTSDVHRLEGFGELAKHSKVIAIGEVGLDYYRTKNQESRIKQQDVFRQFLELGKNLGKPIIIHCRDAYDDLISLLNSKPYTLNAVLHSFTGDFELAQKFLDLGFFLGLNGIITFSDEYNDMIAKVPLERILIETDAPYLAPMPCRGKRNEPPYVEFVAREIAKIKELAFEKVAEQTAQNTRKLFGLR
jgi:TatD DNase family protein